VTCVPSLSAVTRRCTPGARALDARIDLARRARHDDHVHILAARFGTEQNVCAPIDANGNLTADGTRTFEWDARNQLVAVTVGTYRSEFTYDGEQRRVREIEKEDGIIESDRRVLWCGREICEERAADGATVTRRAFKHGEQLGGAALFFAADHLGSVTDVSDASATSHGRYAYDPWGRRTLSAGADVTRVGFTGHLWEAVGSLWVTQYRAFDADLGRWLSDDPLGLKAGTNLYAYVKNEPIIRWDPHGLVAAAGGVTGGAGIALGWFGGHLGGSCSLGVDGTGAIGLVCCRYLAATIGFGAGAGVGGTGMVCPSCQSICDLGGESFQFELNLPTIGASGGGGQEGGGQGFGTGSVTGRGGVGPGYLAYGLSTCTVIPFNRKCEKCR
jgi:RHS repeat-associated protein